MYWTIIYLYIYRFRRCIILSDRCVIEYNIIILVSSRHFFFLLHKHDDAVRLLLEQ